MRGDVQYTDCVNVLENWPVPCLAYRAWLEDPTYSIITFDWDLVLSLLAEKKFGGLIILFVFEVRVRRGTVPLFADGN